MASERDAALFGSERLRAVLCEVESELHEHVGGLRAATHIMAWRRSSAVCELRRAVQQWAAYASSSLKRTLRPDTGRWTRARARARDRGALRRAVGALSRQRTRRLAQRSVAASTWERRTRDAWDAWCVLGGCRVLPLAGRLRRLIAALLQTLATRAAWKRWELRHAVLAAEAASERGSRGMLTRRAMRRWRQAGRAHGVWAGGWADWARSVLLRLPSEEWEALRGWLRVARGVERGSLRLFRCWAEETARERQQLIERRPQELQVRERARALTHARPHVRTHACTQARKARTH